MSGEKVSDRNGGVAAELSQAKEYVDARLDQSGCRRVLFEVRNGHTLDGVFLVVQSEDNLSRLIEVLNWGVHREETAPNKEHEVQEGPFLTSNRTLRQPDWSERASTYSFACESLAATPPFLSETFSPLKDSAQLELPILSPSSGPRYSKWNISDLHFP